MPESADELYALPLEEFTAARNALAERDPSVRGLAKPTVPAWTVNQLARRHADLVGRLVESGQALARAVQKRAPAERLREVQAAERATIEELVGRARTVLEEAGRTATAPMLDRIAATLAAGAQTAEGRAALRAGRLSEELEPAGFAALAGLAPAQPERGESVHDELAVRRREKEARERRRRKLRDELRELEAGARAAEREADRAEAAAEKARAAAEKARRRADEAAAALADLD